MTQPTKIYPLIETLFYDNGEFEINTLLRKEHEGKWFLISMSKKWMFPNEHHIPKYIDMFHADVYQMIIFGKVCINDDGSSKIINPKTLEPIFKLDDDQRSEEERLKSLIIS